MVTALFMGSPGHADHDPLHRTVTIPVAATGVATKGLVLYVNNSQVHNVPKISDPALLVRASSTTTYPAVATTSQAGCAVVDDPAAGKLNRSVAVTLQSGESVNVYAKLTYNKTDVATGQTTAADPVEPFGPEPGQTVTAPSTGPQTVSFGICFE